MTQFLYGQALFAWLVVFESVCFAETDNIEPVASPTLSVVG